MEISPKFYKVFVYIKFFLNLSVWIFLFSSIIFTQKLPFKSYKTSDNLAHSHVSRIYQDKKGFLWFGTWEGLSRFDGYEFVNYGINQGLASHIINDMTEDRFGRLWIAANDNGISLLLDKTLSNQFDSSKSETFISFKVGETIGSNKVNRIMIDSKDYLWCLTDEGVFRAPLSDNPVFTLVQPQLQHQEFTSKLLFEDAPGNVWFAIYNDLFEARDGKVIRQTKISGYEHELITDGLLDDKGRILVLSYVEGLFEFVPATSEWRKLTGDLNIKSGFFSLAKDSKNALWIGGNGILLKFSDAKLTMYSNEQGLNDDVHDSILEDREGNLWIGDKGSGISKLSGTSIVSYSTIGGKTPSVILDLTEVKDNLKVGFGVTNSEKPEVYLSELAGNEFKSVQPLEQVIPGARHFDVKYLNPYWQVLYSGEFQIIKNTLFQMPNGKKLDFKDFFDTPLKNNDAIAFYADDYDYLWFSKPDKLIYRVNTAISGKKIEKFEWNSENKIVSGGRMISGGQDSLWTFLNGGRNARLRNGKLERLQDVESIPPLEIRSAYFDSRRWLWIGTRYDGVYVTENPTAEKPSFRQFSPESGLASITVWSICEDNDGRMYFGTGKGLRRYDPRTRVWRSFTTSDGLLGDVINSLFKDHQGNIWMTFKTGVSKLTPDLERENQHLPPIYITHIKIAGEEMPIYDKGTSEIPPIELAASQNNLTIDFVGLQFTGENKLDYQYKLEGIDEDWRERSKTRSITFANLASGNYRFLVRAINENGLESAQPASFQFKIYPPIYLRWWFIALGILFLSAIVYAFYRLRLQRLLEVERTRTLIATDLHDDIGSNLSKISVLSEVVRLQLEHAGKSDDKLLTSIAEISRNSVSSMSDIVWAINPKRDSALEMVRKMREYAEEIFVPKDIPVIFSEPPKGAKIKLPMDLRRDLYLIFKEAVNNIAKHANCTKVQVDFDVQHHEIILLIEDNGIGFNPADYSNGNGLANMKNRTERLKGSFKIESEPNCGTKLTFKIPQN